MVDEKSLQSYSSCQEDWIVSCDARDVMNEYHRTTVCYSEEGHNQVCRTQIEELYHECMGIWIREEESRSD